MTIKIPATSVDASSRKDRKTRARGYGFIFKLTMPARALHRQWDFAGVIRFVTGETKYFLDQFYCVGIDGGLDR